MFLIEDICETFYVYQGIQESVPKWDCQTTRSKSVDSQPQSVHSPIREDTESIYSYDIELLLSCLQFHFVIPFESLDPNSR